MLRSKKKLNGGSLKNCAPESKRKSTTSRRRIRRSSRMNLSLSSWWTLFHQNSTRKGRKWRWGIIAWDSTTTSRCTSDSLVNFPSSQLSRPCTPKRCRRLRWTASSKNSSTPRWESTYSGDTSFYSVILKNVKTPIVLCSEQDRKPHIERNATRLPKFSPKYSSRAHRRAEGHLIFTTGIQKSN